MRTRFIVGGCEVDEMNLNKLRRLYICLIFSVSIVQSFYACIIYFTKKYQSQFRKYYRAKYLTHCKKYRLTSLSTTMACFIMSRYTQTHGHTRYYSTNTHLEGKAPCRNRRRQLSQRHKRVRIGAPLGRNNRRKFRVRQPAEDAPYPR